VQEFTSPARWKAKQWGIFSAEVVGVGFVMIFDQQINACVLNSGTPFKNDVANVFEPFGAWASFVVLGGFYVGGLAAHDEKARGVFYDGLTASIIASVIATEYKDTWVQFACYVPASLVAYARMLHDAHWASDVVAGALIGFGVGQAVARLNLPPRLAARHVRVTPLFAPGVEGVAVAATF